MSYKVIVEGGGNGQGKSVDIECRKGFRSFLEKLGLVGRMPRIVPGGSRSNAYRDFCTALRGQERALLLVDSEDAVIGLSPWTHLQQRDGWSTPAGATEDDCHLMTQCMEAWLVADRNALAGFFGDGFRDVTKWQDVETVPKPDLLAKLEQATRECQRPYRKGSTSFELLAKVDPGLVRAASKIWAERFCAAVQAMKP